MKKYLLISIALLFFVFSCKKDDLSYLHQYPGLPDATLTGENTMGCLINGVPWVPKVEGGVIGWPSLEKIQTLYGEPRKNIGSLDRFYLRINFEKRTDQDIKLNEFKIREFIHFRIRPVFQKEKINILKSEYYYIEYFKANYGEPWKQYILDTLAPINMEITKLDTVRNIVSGLFDFRLKRISDFKDTIRITNGRFDANYWPL